MLLFCASVVKYKSSRRSLDVLDHLLGDEALMARIKGYINHIVEHQQDDGWLGLREGARAFNSLELTAWLGGQYTHEPGRPRALCSRHIRAAHADTLWLHESADCGISHALI